MRPRSQHLELTPRQLDAACTAWEQGGCLSLGLWGAHNIKAIWGVRSYGQLVALVRAELCDSVDYSAPPTRVVNVRSGELFDVYIGRACYGYEASKWGNPIKLKPGDERTAVLAQYRAWLMEQTALLAALSELCGKVLGCWCAPLVCHGDVLAELADQGVRR